MQVIRKYRNLLVLCGALAIIAAGGAFAAHALTADGLPADHLLFTTSNHCIACHSQVKTDGGEDISIGFQWRASVMANSSRDPYWQASIRRETMDHPSAVAAIEDKCSTCHMPMQRTQARAEGGQGEILKYLKGISSGEYLDEPDAELEKAKDVKGTLAADGVSCTLCHQIQPDNLGQRASLDGGYLIDKTKKPEERDLFGPYDPDDGRLRIMHSATGFVQKRGDHLRDSALCATCHTLLTDALDDKGRPAGTLPEQMPYQEWLHSDYKDSQSCQSCHMPKVQGQAPFTSVHAQLHDDVARHVFVGGNAFLLRLLKDHGAELGVAALPEELEASARRSEALLRDKSAGLDLRTIKAGGGRLSFDVQVSNKTGHKFPTGYPARRAWLHVTVRDGQGVVFESGAPRPDGSVAGADADADPGRFEPHYSRISEPGQVQIYESVMGDYAGRPTTGLVFGSHYLKDNRLLPQGFDKASADPEIAVVGGARNDPRFQAGGDTVTYDVAIPNSHGPLTISVELLYESISYRWAHNLEGYQAPEPQRFLAYYRQHAASAPKLVARAQITAH